MRDSSQESRRCIATVITCNLAHNDDTTSEKDSTCIPPFVHPNVRVITCSSFMWPGIHAFTEEFTLFLYARTPLVTASHNILPRGQKDTPTS
jgi:hypothetical protein